MPLKQIEADTRAVSIDDVQLWLESVAGAQLLDEILARYELYLFLPPGAAVAMTLWTPHPYALGAFHISPRLNLRSDTGGCGKTTTLDVMHALLPRVLRAENLSAAVLFRIVDALTPTILLDEVDTYLYQSDELRGLTNAGHKRGSHAYRCEGDNRTVRAFNAHCACVLAGVGDLPPTLRDRSIVISLVAAPETQRPAPFDPLNLQTEHALAQKTARWAKDNFAALYACKPVLPHTAFNRLADNWRPLFAIAQVAGGHWPQLALDAFNKLTAKPKAPDLDLNLLSDIRQIFARSGNGRVFSSELVKALSELPGRPWSASRNGQKPLTVNRLAHHLTLLGIRSSTIRIGSQQAKGYDLAEFAQPFARLLKDNPPASLWTPEI